MIDPLCMQPAWEAAYRLTEAVAVFLREEEQTAFFHRAHAIVQAALNRQAEVTGPRPELLPEQELEAMRFTEQKRLALIRRLDAAYSVAGREALAKMSKTEVHLLHVEKLVDLRSMQAHLAQYPHDELGQLRHEKAAREAGDIAAYLKSVAEKERKTRGREPDMDMG